MPWAMLLLLLLTYCSDVSSYATLTQPPSQSARLGNPVRLTCTLSSEHQSYVVDWYQQKVGEAPRLLVYRDSTRASGIPDRFTGSKSGGERYLSISGVRAEDEATYYCGEAEGSGSDYMFVFGGGTQLTVTGQPAAPPTVHLFPPSSDELTSKSKATLVCLVDDFTPGAIDVTWLADGSPITSNVETTRPTKRNDKYVASSYLSLTADKYQEKSEYTCKVTHDGKSYQKSVQREACSA